MASFPVLPPQKPDFAAHFATLFASHFFLRFWGKKCHESQMKFTKRSGMLHLRKRVPRRYDRVEPRDYVWLSLHTDSETIAKQKAPQIWADIIAGWEAKLAGDTGDAEVKFDAARDLAAARGYRFLSAEKVGALPIPEILDRVDLVMKASRPGAPALAEAEALLGGAREPKITVSRALDLFWTFAADRTRGKSKDQIRRWENPRKKAVANFISVVGNKAMAEITADDMLDFREWWWNKIEAEDLTPNSGNKDLSHLGDMLKTVNRAKRLGIKLPLEGLSFKAGEKRTRPAFSRKWLVDHFTAPGALDGLNLEARCLLLGMINTGYRPSEGAGLLQEHIVLDAPIPHIKIEPVGRTLKSQYSKRIIPLTGISLEAFKLCPNGFPRYRDNPNLSATINKFMRENGLCETPGHTLYSIRHSFEDRMLAAKVDERIRRDLFGHSLNRERYGQGATLEHLFEVVQSMSI